MPWLTPFEEPIPLGGRQLSTLQQAEDYVMALMRARNAPDFNRL